MTNHPHSYIVKHTPGPWKAIQPKHDPQAWDVVAENGGILAKLVWGDVSAANATLMAAAPELLAALEKMLEGGVDYAGNDYLEITLPDSYVAFARAAINKARGRTSPNATHGQGQT
jgi:hypothetical protein